MRKWIVLGVLVVAAFVTPVVARGSGTPVPVLGNSGVPDVPGPDLSPVVNPATTATLDTSYDYQGAHVHGTQTSVYPFREPGICVTTNVRLGGPVMSQHVRC